MNGMVDEIEVLVPDPQPEVTRALNDMLKELYPDSARDIRGKHLSRRKGKRTGILNKYSGISTSLSARGFDTTELNNRIALEQSKTDALDI